MKKYLLIFSAFLFIACSVLSSPTPTLIAPTVTLQPLTQTEITPSDTPQPTVTPEPSSTAPPIQEREAINASTIGAIGLITQVEVPDLRMVRFSPDGSLIAVSTGNQDNFSMKILDTEDLIVQNNPGPFSGIVWDIAFSPDNSILASAASDEGGHGVRIWQVSDGALLQVPESPAVASSVAFSSDGNKLAVGGLAGKFPTGEVWIYDTATWQVFMRLDAYGQNVTGLTYSPDGNQLASSGSDGKIRLWRVSDGKLIRTMDKDRQASGLTFSSNGGLLASTFCSVTGTYGCEKGGILVWRVSDGTVVQQFDDIAESQAFSPDGSLLASGSGVQDPVVRLRYVADWSLSAVLPASAYTLAFSPDGTRLATGNHSSLSIWGILRE